MKSAAAFGVLAVSLLLPASASLSNSPPPTSTFSARGAATQPTFHKDVPPILQGHCQALSPQGSNDPSLTPEQIALISAWANAGAPAGSPEDAPPPRHWAEGWNIPTPDLVVQMPKAVSLPASGDVEYTHEIVPTGFAEDKWVQMLEIRPSSRDHVHHAVLYIRPPNSTWLRKAPVGVPFTPSSFSDAKSTPRPMQPPGHAAGLRPRQ